MTGNTTQTKTKRSLISGDNDQVAPKRPKKSEVTVDDSDTESESGDRSGNESEVHLWKLPYWKYALINFKCKECRDRDYKNRDSLVVRLKNGLTRVMTDYCDGCRDANIMISNIYWARFQAEQQPQQQQQKKKK